MLLGGKQADSKKVAVLTRNPQFNRLLASILDDWKFFTVEDLSAASVIFVERGLELPDHDAQIIWLTSMPLEEGDFLTVPFSVTELYLLLETLFFPRPRRHIRVAMEAAVDLQIDNSWLEGRLISLSDRGGRICCASEIPRGKMLNMEVKLAGRMIRLPAEVLYCIPAGDSPGHLEPQIGVLFKPAKADEFDALRHFIEKVCIESACSRENVSLNDPCLSWLELPIKAGQS